MTAGNATSTTTAYEFVPHAGIILESAFLALVSVLGTFGNILVILAVCKSPSLRTRSNAFIVLLATTDLITTGTLTPFFILTLLRGRWPYAEIYCKVIGYMALICLALSVLMLCVIAITRYIAVTRPRHQFLKQCNHWVLLCTFSFLACAAIFIVIMPEVVNFGEVGYNSDLGHCSMVCEGKDWWFCAVLFLSGVITTMAILPMYYALTLWVVRKSRMTVAAINRNERMSTNANSNALNNINRIPKLSREEIRLTKKLMMLFLIFFICWFPYSIVILGDRHGIMPTPLHRFTNLFMWLNSCLNPYLYAWMMRSFRKAYKDVTKFEKWRKYLPCPKIRDESDPATSVVMTRGGAL
ncbi:G-protein coupled receptor moody-like [Diadema antillarum]|uniref:G-protein coupled receptor moody-like n=1 Tax=Diadema antillarum TaxID=105358 RepID=UPI003A84ACF9